MQDRRVGMKMKAKGLCDHCGHPVAVGRYARNAGFVHIDCWNEWLVTPRPSRRWNDEGSANPQ